MKRLGLISIFLLSLSLFFVPKNTYAALSQTDLDRWRNYANTSFATSSLFVYRDAFNYFAQYVFNNYKSSNIPPSAAFQYIRVGVPDNPENMVYQDSYDNNVEYTSMDDLVSTKQKNGSDQEKLTAGQIATRLSEMQAKESINDRFQSGGITKDQYDNAINSVTNASNASVSQTQYEKTKATDIDGAKCNIDILGSSWDMLGCLNVFFGWLIKVIFLNIAGFFLWLAGNLLNYSIQFGILDFKSWAPDSIYPLWQIVRQIISLCVVFAGLYIGFMYIINQQDTFIKKYIPWLVVFALFVNFSYPITRGLVDVSNIISLNIYSQIVGGDTLVGKNEANTAGAVIMSRLGLQELIGSANSVNNQTTENVSKLNGIGGALMAVIMVLYTAYILGFAALLFMIRNIVLVLSIIFSPLMFVNAVIPKFGEKAAWLREFFFKQLALSVVFMVMLYFSVRVMSVFDSIRPIDKPDITMVFNITIMLVVLHIMLKVTRSLSGEIGKGVEGLYKTAALGVAGGGMAFAGRATLGRVASRVAESDWLDKKQGTVFGRSLMNLSSSVANSTFDSRNTKLAQGIGKMGGIEIKGGTTRTYTTDLAAKQEAFATKYNSIRNDEARDEFMQSTRQSQSLQGVALAGVGALATKVTGNESLGRSIAQTDNALITEKFGKKKAEEERQLNAKAIEYEGEKDEAKKKAMYERASDKERAVIDKHLEDKQKATQLALDKDLDSYKQELADNQSARSGGDIDYTPPTPTPSAPANVVQFPNKSTTTNAVAGSAPQQAQAASVAANGPSFGGNDLAAHLKNLAA